MLARNTSSTRRTTHYALALEVITVGMSSVLTGTPQVNIIRSPTREKLKKGALQIIVYKITQIFWY